MRAGRACSCSVAAAAAAAAAAAGSKLPSQRLQLQRVRRAGPGRDGCLYDLGGAVVGGVEGGDGHDDGARLPQRRGDRLWQGAGLCAVVLRSHQPRGCRGAGEVGDAEFPVRGARSADVREGTIAMTSKGGRRAVQRLCANRKYVEDTGGLLTDTRWLQGR